MTKILVVALALSCVTAGHAAAQAGGQAGDPMRIVIMVDNSQTPLEPLPQIRRGLQQFVNALPPNHELMLVTTGGTMNIRVQPTRDYIEVYKAIGEINFMRSTGNALIGSIQEVYDRYLRTVERRLLGRKRIKPVQANATAERGEEEKPQYAIPSRFLRRRTRVIPMTLRASCSHSRTKVDALDHYKVTRNTPDLFDPPSELLHEGPLWRYI